MLSLPCPNLSEDALSLASRNILNWYRQNSETGLQFAAIITVVYFFCFHINALLIT